MTLVLVVVYLTLVLGLELLVVVTRVVFVGVMLRSTVVVADGVFVGVLLVLDDDGV